MAEKTRIRTDYWIAAILLAAMATIAFANVLSRYFFHFSIGATEELTINLFVWMTVVGTGIAFERGAQLGMVTFFNMFPTRMQKVAVVFSAILSTGLFVLVCVYMIQAIIDERLVCRRHYPRLVDGSGHDPGRYRIPLFDCVGEFGEIL